jgi:stage V sporulation protein G
MEITEVRVKLMEDTDDRLQAFCSITFDHAFVVRDLKIIEGTNGPFVAMPSRKLTSHCPVCRCKNHLRAAYCNQCGAKQREDRLHRDVDGRAKLYADIAHPINSACREMIQNRVIAEYHTERERAKQPGYISRYDDDYLFDAGEVFDAPLDAPTSEPSSLSSSSETRVDPPHTSGELHRSASNSGPEARTPHQKPPRKTGDFGAGIFD